MMKSHFWYVKFPKDAYAMGPIRFEKSVNECEVRAWARGIERVKRLPSGFQCWTASQDEENAYQFLTRRVQ